MLAYFDLRQTHFLKKFVCSLPIFKWNMFLKTLYFSPYFIQSDIYL